MKWGGVKVLFRPLVDPNWSLPGNQGTWRGMIGNYFNATQWDEWFQSYSQFVIKFAMLAEEANVEDFSVGAEIDTTARQETHWRALVQRWA